MSKVLQKPGLVLCGPHQIRFELTHGVHQESGWCSEAEAEPGGTELGESLMMIQFVKTTH